MHKPVENQRREKRRILAAATAASALVCGIAATNVATSRADVHLSVDGVTRPVTTFENTVGGVLRSAGVQMGNGDEITPTLSTRVKDGDTITLRRARPVTVTIGGKEQQINTTAYTQAELLQDLAGREAVISASRASVRSDLAMIADRGTPVTVVADGKETNVELTHRFDIDQVLQSAKVAASPIDRVTLESQGGRLQVVVTRVTRGESTKESPVKFKTVKKETDDLEKGKEKVETEGKDGIEKIYTYQQTVGDDVQVKVETKREVVTKPVDEVVLVGTADPEELAARRRAQGIMVDANGDPIPSQYSGADPRGIAQAMVAQRGWGEGEFQCLLQLWERESHWNPYAQNPSSGAYGIPQSLPGSKMASAGADWQTNPATQITWGLGYIANRYGTPCGAWGHSNAVGWY